MRKKLKKVYIEITNVCNLSCAFCPGTSRKPEFMSVERFGTVLAKLSGITEYVYLHVMGEPLLHPELGNFLQMCSDAGYKVNLTTNGALIARRAGELLDSSALRQVNFSLHSQEALQNPEKLEQYLCEIFRFADRALKKGGIYISFRLWNRSSEAADKYNSLVAEELERWFHPGFSVKEALRNAGRIRLGEGLFLNSADVFEWPAVSEGDCGGEGFCLGLRDQIAILADGTVVPCCLDSEGVLELGNLFEAEIGDILESSRAKAIYDGFSQRRTVEELCRKCGYRTRFSV